MRHVSGFFRRQTAPDAFAGGRGGGRLGARMRDHMRDEALAQTLVRASARGMGTFVRQPFLATVTRSELNRRSAADDHLGALDGGECNLATAASS